MSGYSIDYLVNRQRDTYQIKPMSPNPAGYYLNLTPETEAEIAALGYRSTKYLVYEVADCLSLKMNQPTSFSSCLKLSAKAEAEINRLSESDLIALLRWLTERLSFLVLPPITVQSHAATTT